MNNADLKNSENYLYELYTKRSLEKTKKYKDKIYTMPDDKKGMKEKIRQRGRIMSYGRQRWSHSKQDGQEESAEKVFEQ